MLFLNMYRKGVVISLESRFQFQDCLLYVFCLFVTVDWQFFQREKQKSWSQLVFVFHETYCGRTRLDGKEIYKNVPIVLVHVSFLTLSLPSTTSLLKLPNKHQKTLNTKFTAVHIKKERFSLNHLTRKAYFKRKRSKIAT